MELFETCLLHTKSRIQPRFALMKGSASIRSAELRVFAGMVLTEPDKWLFVCGPPPPSCRGCGDLTQVRLQSYSSGGGGSKVSLIGKQQGISRLPPPPEGSLLLDVLGKENLFPAFSTQRPHIPTSVVLLSSSQHLMFPSASILWSPSLTLQPSYRTSAVPSSPRIMQDSPHPPNSRSLPSSHLRK